MCHDVSGTRLSRGARYVRRWYYKLISPAVVGDITPREGISKAEKHRLEAVRYTIHRLVC